MLNIGIIVPSELVGVAESVSSGFKENLNVVEGSMGKAMELAKDFETKGYNAIIVRGGTGLLLNEYNINIPVVQIPITEIDIFNAVNDAKKLDTKFVFFAFKNMLGPIESFMKISGKEYPVIEVETEKDVEKKLEEISYEGFKVVVGGGIINKFTLKHNIEPVVIKTGKESIITAINEAIRITNTKFIEKQQFERFRAIIQNTNDGIVGIDKNGYISVFNSSAEELFKIKSWDVLGKHINSILPDLELTRVLESGLLDSENIKNVEGKNLMISNIPIKINGKVTDAISLIQDVSKIQNMEKKIRREIITTGMYTRYTFEDIIGKSETSKEVTRIAKEYAKVDSSILIEGETGTGKEILVQSIHNYSKRSKGPFVAVNCAALPESLLESELFGYAPGAFTGADRKGKQGLFELAHNGTIFLDEICELKPSVQSSFLRVLQEKQVMRIGDNKVTPIDVRVIVASNKKLEPLVEAGKFREDLYYRINVLKIEIPPLRDKKEDIPDLLSHFIENYSNKLGKPIVNLSDEALEYITLYDWPGNIRELKNFVERLMVVTKSTELGLSDIKDRFSSVLKLKTDYKTKEPVENVNKKTNKDYKSNHKHNIKFNEKEEIMNKLRENMGVINYTAKSLGISRTTLWRRMKEYNIDVNKIDFK